MTAAKTITNDATGTALERIASTAFEAAWSEYRRQREAVEALPPDYDYSNGNPLNALDDAFQAMMEQPAPDLEAVFRKLKATTGTIAGRCGWETQYYVERVLRDMRRLFGTINAEVPERFALMGLRPDMTREEAVERLCSHIEARDFPDREADWDLESEDCDRIVDEAERIAADFYAHIDGKGA